ncbi:hypothetical protein H6F98_23090 [Microcoleus sp. FACHB-SPT15]|nr:hypothetical protein [Microcoleus sp. FACHB-SPT15]MBD1808316.1 hypothetical protein [Microcoleus sp. FACHB-SPT15]
MIAIIQPSEARQLESVISITGIKIISQTGHSKLSDLIDAIASLTIRQV